MDGPYVRHRPSPENDVTRGCPAAADFRLRIRDVRRNFLQPEWGQRWFRCTGWDPTEGKGNRMKTAMDVGRIRIGQMGAGLVVMVTMLCVMHLGLARAGEHHTLQLLLNKGIITQQENDQAVQEEDRAKVEEEKRAKQANFFTKNGLQVRLGGFAEFDFIGDNTQSFQELVG